VQSDLACLKLLDDNDDDDDDDLVVDVFVSALPRARGMHRSVNLIEGDTLELHCEPWGIPKPTVSWWRESGPLNMSDDRIKVRNDSTLVIESLVPDDRDQYYCVVTSRIIEIVYVRNSSTLVRVKGMLTFC